MMEQRAINDAPLCAQNIGEKAYHALLEEVYTTPKPGLVDRFSNGAHQDMDVSTFEKSAEALRPWFIRMATQGYLLQCEHETLFQTIRKTGILAEQAMFHATDGVNTHKGLIFTLGIFCAAAGRCIREQGTVKIDTLIQTQQAMTRRILKAEVEALVKAEVHSNGVKNLKTYGTTGIRGEAIAGYPSVIRIALPVLRQGIRDRKNWNQIKLQVLFNLMSWVEDSNVIARCNPQVLRKMQKEAKQFLADGGAYKVSAIKELRLMDTDYIKQNISPGGCADLLATTIFLEMLCKEGRYDSLWKAI